MIVAKELLKEYLFISSMALSISLILTPIIRRKCVRHNLLDFPNDPRRIHTTPRPRLGGIAVYLAFYLPLFAIFFTNGVLQKLFIERSHMFFSLFVTSSLVFAIGVYDDIWGATVTQKFIVQVIAAAFLYVLGFKITLVSIPFVGPASLGVWGFPLTILWIVGVTNALNFIDGIDGLACGVGFFSISTMFILSIFLYRPLTALFAAALAGALLGFSMYNFAPASIFMGDSGSLFIGFIIAAISLQSSQKSSTAVVLLIPIIALGLPITDTLLAILRRVGKGLSPFSADREHIHHRLLNKGFSSRQVVLILYGVTILLGSMALLMTTVNNNGLTLILISLSIMVIAGLKMLGYSADMALIQTMAHKRIQEKRQLLRHQQLTEEMMMELAAVSELIELKKLMIRYFEMMELDVGRCVIPTLTPDMPGYLAVKELELSWCSMRHEEERALNVHLWSVAIPLVAGQKKCGELVLGKTLPEEHTSTPFLEIAVIGGHLKHSIEKQLAAILTNNSHR